MGGRCKAVVWRFVDTNPLVSQECREGLTARLLEPLVSCAWGQFAWIVASTVNFYFLDANLLTNWCCPRKWVLTCQSSVEWVDMFFLNEQSCKIDSLPVPTFSLQFIIWDHGRTKEWQDSLSLPPGAPLFDLCRSIVDFYAYNSVRQRAPMATSWMLKTSFGVAGPALCGRLMTEHQMAMGRSPGTPVKIRLTIIYNNYIRGQSSPNECLRFWPTARWLFCAFTQERTGRQGGLLRGWHSAGATLRGGCRRPLAEARYVKQIHS